MKDAIASPNPRDEPALMRRLALAGLNLEKGRGLYGGNDGQYLRALRVFAEGRGRDAVAARAALEAGDPGAAAKELHALGVILTMLGADEAGEVATAVEWALRNGAAPQPGLDHLDELLRAICEAVAGPGIS